ncbi:MAG: glycosyltransferase family 4 protein [Candidatus Moranbacteria bacterium]|nr:glycosyltransferase family 4 protein [Candidatus Moranbacteria bacterium]
MKIGIDARFFGSLGKGLGRYTQKLVENLEMIDHENDYFIFLRRENFDEYVPRNPKFKKVLADYRWYTFSEQLAFPRLLGEYNLDLMHFPHFNVPLFYRRKFLVTVHDLILIHFPTMRNTTLNPLFYWLKFLAYKIIIRSALVRSESIITVSNFTKNDILKNYPAISEGKISVTYEAAQNHHAAELENSADVLKKYGIIEPYMMYVGNAYPHKNLERLIESFLLAKKKISYLKLVLVGKEDYFYARLKRSIDRPTFSGIIFAGFVPDDELDILFASAEAFVFPSLYEGFGLPPLEAMARGVPVISSDHPCMKEVLGESAHFFDGNDVNQMAEAIEKISTDKKLREDLIAKGFEQVKKYDWMKMAKETLEIYKCRKEK